MIQQPIAAATLLIDITAETDSQLDHQVAAVGTANGAFGELLQGVLPDEEHFLVTMPISCYSKCKILLGSNNRKLEIFPAHKKKSLHLARLILNHFDKSITGKIILTSELEEGKGLASSSADLVATARAFEQVLNELISVELLQHFLKQIEPTDGVMFKGCVAFYHRKVQLLNFIGSLPPIAVMGIDEGGVIDTISYNTINRGYTMSEMITYDHLLEKITKGIQQHDLKTIGEVATCSAMMNQRHNPKKNLDYMLRVCKIVDGLGVIIAHSGTYIGLMLDKYSPYFTLQFNQAANLLKHISAPLKLFETIHFNHYGKPININM